MNISSHLSQKRKRGKILVFILQFNLILLFFSAHSSPVVAQPFPTRSGPIDITPNGNFVFMVNPDNNSVSIFNTQTNTRVGNPILVGREPQSVAIHPGGARVYVTNMVDGTVSVFRFNQNTGAIQFCKNVKVGTEPYGAAVTPDGNFLYVANASSNNVTVINTSADFGPVCNPASNPVVTTIPVESDPRGVAITADSFKVYVTHFFAQLRPGRTPYEEGRDDSREGRVTLISTLFQRVEKTIALNPLLDTGFRADGSTINRIPCSVTGCIPPAGGGLPTGAFPNLMQSITINPFFNRAYLPNTAASPDGPVRFNVNVQSFLSVFDTVLDQDSGQTINMNKGIQNESETTRLFPTNPFAIAFKRSNPSEGYVTAKAINQIIRVNLDATGTPTINAPNPVRVNVGKDPRGIVIHPDDTRAYVMNYISRNLTVVDISSATPTVITTIDQPDLLPTPGSFEEFVHRGKELFNTSIGPAGTAPQSDPPAGRMSSEGWGSCFSCHEDGRTDNVTWMFADGPRQAISMDATFDPHDYTRQRVLNFSASRDEVQDFELNIRGVSGGQGLITDGQPVNNLTPTANSGRSTDLDAIATFIQLGVRSRIAPPVPQSAQKIVAKGRQVFQDAGCVICHSGGDWTSSIRDFTPPPPSGEPIVDAQLIRFLSKVGTFDIDLFEDGRGNEIRANTVGFNQQARGLDGFNPPSLLSVFATAPYFHNGSARTLEQVIVGTPRHPGDVHVIPDPRDRFPLIAFLRTIDEKTVPFQQQSPVPPVPTPTPVTNFRATLSGGNEVPPVSTTATATATFTLQGTTVSYRIDVTNLGGPGNDITAAHIHSGATGVNGPIRVSLLPTPVTGLSVPLTGNLVQGTFTSANVQGITFDQLIAEMRNGTAYVNVHTTVNPNGEIRGQIQLQP
jgi:YVTN family beta-propeller protein